MDETTPQLARERVAEAYRRAHDERLNRQSAHHRRRLIAGRLLGRRS